MSYTRGIRTDIGLHTAWCCRATSAGDVQANLQRVVHARHTYRRTYSVSYTLSIRTACRTPSSSIQLSAQTGSLTVRPDRARWSYTRHGQYVYAQRVVHRQYMYRVSYMGGICRPTACRTRAVGYSLRRPTACRTRAVNVQGACGTRAVYVKGAWGTRAVYVQGVVHGRYTYSVSYTIRTICRTRAV